MQRFFDDEQTGLRPDTRDRDEIDDAYKWDVDDIYEDWNEWEADIEAVRETMDEFVALEGTLSEGPDRLLETYRLSDEIGMTSYKLYRYPQLKFDVDQRNNDVQARLQQVQQLFAEYQAKTAWFSPEILTIDQETMEQWIDETPELEKYRFPISEVYRSQKHVLDEEGEQLLAYGSRFRSAPVETYRALTTADVDFKTIELTDGESVEISRGEYANILRTCRNQEDRRRAFEAHYSIYEEKRNTFAALYNGICQRDWAQAQSRNYDGTAEAALDDDNVPVSVLETLIDVAADGAEPLRRYHELRKEVLDLDDYHLYDGQLPLVDIDEKYPYDDVRPMLIESVAPLGDDYQERMKQALEGGWIDVYENDGKRDGAYSAGVYGVHPYMLLNYTDTIGDVFTLAHELGHTLHTLLSCEHQPFATSSYTIFVAEVASTTAEALLLDYLLDRTDDPKQRAVLLQQSIGNIAGTFYTQAMFADFELRAHRAVEQGQPLTADALDAMYLDRYENLYDEVIETDDLYRVTWSRIPHFYQSPYYVYQYATCYASSAEIVEGLLSDDDETRQQTVDDYLGLLKSGGNDHPMQQLRDAGVDLEKPDVVRAVTRRMDELVDMLDDALQQIEG